MATIKLSEYYCGGCHNFLFNSGDVLDNYRFGDRRLIWVQRPNEESTYRMRVIVRGTNILKCGLCYKSLCAVVYYSHGFNRDHKCRFLQHLLTVKHTEFTVVMENGMKIVKQWQTKND